MRYTKARLEEIQGNLFELLDTNGELTQEQQTVMDVISYALGESDSKPVFD